MKEDVYWEYTVFYLRKSSILTPSFDIFILKVLESGLPSYWQQQVKTINGIVNEFNSN